MARSVLVLLALIVATACLFLAPADAGKSWELVGQFTVLETRTWIPHTLSRGPRFCLLSFDFSVVFSSLFFFVVVVVVLLLPLLILLVFFSGLDGIPIILIYLLFVICHFCHVFVFDLLLDFFTPLVIACFNGFE